MADRKTQLVTLRAFLMLAVITVTIATFTAIVSAARALEDLQSGSGSISLLRSFGSGGSQRMRTCLGCWLKSAGPPLNQCRHLQIDDDRHAGWTPFRDGEPSWSSRRSVDYAVTLQE
jgi:hypothetical protein